MQLSRLQTLKNPLTVAVHLPRQSRENWFIHLGTSILREVRWRGLDSCVEARHHDPLLLRALLPPEMLTSSALEPFHLHLEAPLNPCSRGEHRLGTYPVRLIGPQMPADAPP